MVRNVDLTSLVAWSVVDLPLPGMNVTIPMNRSNADEGFESYDASSIDPGSSALVATAIVCVALYSFLPWAVTFCEPRNVHRVPSEVPFTALAKSDREKVPACESAEQRDEVQREGGEIDDGHNECRPSLTPSIPFDPKPSRRRRLQDAISSKSDSTLRVVIAHDKEAKRIYGLALPYLLKSLVSAVADNGLLIIVGQMVGTRELAALALVDLIVGHTSEAVGGVHESLITLIGFSRGANNDRLTGEYIQLAVTSYVLFSIPFLYIGSVHMEAILLFFGMDEATAAIGKRFAIPFLSARLLRGVASCLRAVLDVCELAFISSMLSCVGDVLSTCAVLVCALYWDPSLEKIGLVILVVEVLMLLMTMGLIATKKWFHPYYGGLFHSMALMNLTAAKQMLGTAASLTAGNLLTYGEWSILALFANTLGPAEVAAWGLLGTLWASLESFTSAIADAAEVRVALLLGSGLPNEAKLSAYKSIFIAFLFSVLSTSILFTLSDEIPRWLTSDDTLRVIISELLPLIGVGNVTLTMGTMAWTIIGAQNRAQNRYQLATALGIAGSWLVTVPLSAFLTIRMRINLKGQTAAVVTGYLVSGFVTNVVLFSSDWRKISDNVIRYNAENDVELSDDEDESDDDEASDDGSSVSDTLAASDISMEV